MMPARWRRCCLGRGLLAVLGAATLALGAVACGAVSPAARESEPPAAAPRLAALPPGVQAAVEGARREGRVVVFGQTSDPAQEERVRRGFREFYGFDLAIELVSGLHPQKAAELTAAARQGVASGIDLFWTDLSIKVLLDAGGLVQEVDWPMELGLPREYLLDQGMLRVHDGFLANVFYNTQRTPPELVPQCYEDLLHPRLRGAIAAPRDPTPLMHMTFALGEARATRIVEGLSEQQVAFLPTYPEVRNRVAAGEFLIGLGTEPTRDARRGAPLANAPLDVAVVTPWGFVLLRDAAHPHAARLLAYYFVTPAGQALLDEVWANTLATTEHGTAWLLTRDKTVFTVTREFIENDAGRLKEKYAAILGLR
ncbi:MAG TPA: ABC transporter substrate-binding protein [Chloroflexota bacterium]|nr:ABC transporter substrate-binding protein [Chloroflexota bacterium]